MFANIATIDGPPAAGKTTLASLLAKELNGIHLDSGAVFRSLTLSCMEKGVNIRNPKDVVNHLPQVNIHLSGDKTFLNQKDVSEEIREPYVTNNVCFISNLPEVRTFVKELQLSYAKTGKIVCDGRKVGTEVFPEAKYKFYLTAAQDVRILRRFRQLLAKDSTVCYSDVRKDLMMREAKEQENGILLVPKGAIIIDNSCLTVEETLKIMTRYLEQ